MAQTDIELSDLSVTLEPAKDVAGLEKSWQELETRADGSFFTSWNWIGTWLATARVAPLLLTVRAGEEIVALALFQPVRMRRHGLGTNALLLHQSGDLGEDIITIEHNGFLADRRVAAAATDAGISFLKSAAIPNAPFRRWSELHFAGVTNAFDSRAKATGLMILPWAQRPSWFANLQAVRDGNGSYLESLSSNTRYQIRRAMRLYEKRGPLTAHPAETADEALAYYEGLKDLHQRYWEGRGKPGGFSYPYFERYHRALLTNCLPGGSVELVCVSAGESVIGYVYNFIYRGCVYAYQTGLHYEEDSKLKPGLVSHYLCIERHLASGAHTYDFMAGDHRYKRNLGEAGPDIGHIILQRRTPGILIETALRRLKDAAARALRKTPEGDDAEASGAD